jgi:dTMP kinase
MSSGRFVVFEGGDASGKSTQAQRVAAAWGALFTREPGGTAVGEILRQLVLEPEPGRRMGVLAEALVIAAARAEHVDHVIRPALEAGKDVVCDRFVASSIVYQGVASGVGVATVRAINEIATRGLEPDVVVLVDVPVEVSRARLGGVFDRFEAEEQAFHERVRAAYRELAAADPDRWVVVDGSQPVDAVGAAVDVALAARWPGR